MEINWKVKELSTLAKLSRCSHYWAYNNGSLDNDYAKNLIRESISTAEVFQKYFGQNNTYQILNSDFSFLYKVFMTFARGSSIAYTVKKLGFEPIVGLDKINAIFEKYEEEFQFLKKLHILFITKCKLDYQRLSKSIEVKRVKTSKKEEQKIFYDKVTSYLIDGLNFIEIDEILFKDLPFSNGAHSRSKYFNICRHNGWQNEVDNINLKWFNEVNKLLLQGYTMRQIYDKIGTPLDQNYDCKGVESARECYKRLKAKYNNK